MGKLSAIKPLEEGEKSRIREDRVNKESCFQLTRKGGDRM